MVGRLYNIALNDFSSAWVIYIINLLVLSYLKLKIYMHFLQVKASMTQVNSSIIQDKYLNPFSTLLLIIKINLFY